MNNDKYLTISQINKYIKYKLDHDEHLNTVFLRGEISNFKNHTTGHFYFTLKDEGSRLLAVMFKTYASKVNFIPQDGAKVLVRGRISAYEATGNYQIYVEEMQEDGVGNLYLEFEKLKKKLQEQGLFDPVYKKPIPKFPKKIGVITASTGAAIKDIITTINRRYRLAEIILFPCLVQGEYAAPDIVKNIKRANSYDLDVLIVGRGGGSIEDLWAFNEEIVARAIFESNIPIISAVGHEIDFTISDFVSDLRAPTPTAAGELAVPSTLELKQYLKQLDLRFAKDITYLIDKKRKTLSHLKNSYVLKNPMNMYEIKQQKLDILIDKLLYVIKDKVQTRNNYLVQLDNDLKVKIEKILDKKNNKFFNLLSKLEPLNPIRTIKRGYSITKSDNHVVTSVKNLKKDMMLATSLSDGVVTSKIVNVEVYDGE